MRGLWGLGRSAGALEALERTRFDVVFLRLSFSNAKSRNKKSVSTLADTTRRAA
jgi:hypothetical protein